MEHDSSSLQKTSICHSFATLVAHVSYILMAGFWPLFSCRAQERALSESRLQPIAPDTHGIAVPLPIVITLFLFTHDRPPLAIIMWVGFSIVLPLLCDI